MNSLLLARVTLPKFSIENQDRQNASDPNIWFSQRFPEATNRFGSAFMIQSYVDTDGLARIRPLELNTDFFADALGGDKRIGHRVVFYTPENSFYFFDPCIGAFCSTTEAKLEALLSNYLIRCAQDCSQLADIESLVTDFRKDQVLGIVIERAKALLAADQSFFQGASGHRRMIDGRVLDPCEDPLYVQFVKRGIIREPDAKLTVADAFHRYYQYCKGQRQNPLTRAEFRELVAEAIREEYRIGLRHDIVDERGKQQHGWLGINCLLGSTTATGRN